MFKAVYKYCDKSNTEGKTKIISPEDMGLDNDSLVEAYDALVEKMKRPPYSLFESGITAMSSSLEKQRDVFINSDLDKKAIVISRILSGLHCNPETSDLSVIGGSKNTAIIQPMDKLKDSIQIHIINQSVTGLFENYSPDLRKI